MTKVVIYEGWDDSRDGAFAYVPSTGITYKISDYGLASSAGNGYYLSGYGIVFNASSVVGFSSAAVLEVGFDTQILDRSDTGAALSNIQHFAEAGNGVIFYDANIGAVYYQSGYGASPVQISTHDVEEAVTVGGNAYYTDCDDVYRYVEGGAPTVVFDDAIYGTNTIQNLAVYGDDLLVEARYGSTDYYYVINGTTNSVTWLYGLDVYTVVGFGEGVIYYHDNITSAGRELYAYNIATNTPAFVADLSPGSASTSFPDMLDRFENTWGSGVYFVADDGGIGGEELWYSDGTSSGTVRLTGYDKAAGDMDFYNTGAEVVVVNGLAYFAAHNSATGAELWVTDGTEAGTRLVKDILPGVNGSNPRNMFELDGKLYFSIRYGPDEDQLWESDGTFHGTRPVSDPSGAGASAIDPTYATVVDITPTVFPYWEYLGYVTPDVGWTYGWHVGWFYQDWENGWYVGWTYSWYYGWAYGWNLGYQWGWGGYYFGWGVGWHTGWTLGWNVGWTVGWHLDGWTYGWTIGWYYGF